MGSLLIGNARLRGRASLELVVPTLDYRLAKEFWQLEDPRLALRVHAEVGGTPAYRRVTREAGAFHPRRTTYRITGLDRSRIGRRDRLPRRAVTFSR